MNGILGLLGLQLSKEKNKNKRKLWVWSLIGLMVALAFVYFFNKVLNP